MNKKALVIAVLLTTYITVGFTLTCMELWIGALMLGLLMAIGVGWLIYIYASIFLDK